MSKYVNLLATATQQNVLLEVEVEELRARVAQLEAQLADAPVEGDVVS